MRQKNRRIKIRQKKFLNFVIKFVKKVIIKSRQKIRLKIRQKIHQKNRNWMMNEIECKAPKHLLN